MVCGQRVRACVPGESRRRVELKQRHNIPGGLVKNSAVVGPQLEEAVKSETG